MRSANHCHSLCSPQLYTVFSMNSTITPAHLSGWRGRLLIDRSRFEVMAEFVDVIFFFGCLIYKGGGLS